MPKGPEKLHYANTDSKRENNEGCLIAAGRCHIR